jgi:hypothetical protein
VDGAVHRDARAALARRVSERGHRRSQQSRRRQREGSGRAVTGVAALAELRRDARLEPPRGAR